PNDARAGDARKHFYSEAGFRTNTCGPNYESEGEGPRFQAANWRSVWTYRGPERRARLLFDKRRHPQSISLQGATTEFHQPDYPGRSLSGTYGGGRDGDSWQHRYCDG